jgi:hypothetical protein
MRRAAITVMGAPVLAALLLGAAMIGCGSSVSAAGVSRGNAHYFVFEDDGAGSIIPVFHRLVRLSTPPVSLTPSQAADRLALRDRLVAHRGVQLEAPGGAVVYRDVVDTPAWLRGEFASNGSGATIDGHVLAITKHTFVVRVPVVAGAKLRISGHGAPDATFDVDQLAANPALAPGVATVAPPPPLNSANRVDMLILGDGYTAGQASNFAADASSLMNTFFNLTPYAEYRNYVNVTTLFTPSPASGADHPPYNAGCVAGDPSCCGDSAMQSDPLAGTFVSTAFDAAFCTQNIHRLLTVNTANVYAAAAAAPDWDVIMVLVNDDTYGGSGGEVSVVSMHAASANIAQHEYGHVFTRLADEYNSAYPGFPPCSDVNGALPACERNVTDETSRTRIKWGAWILGSTPLPTPSGDALFATAVGLFQGARYLSSGMYRPGDNCLMRSLGQPFCQVASEAYVLRLYQGGWGVPVNGIDTIEPGSESPPPSVVQQPVPSSVTFSVSLLQPVGAPPLDVNWSVNGTAVPGEHSNSFSYTPPGTGNYDVRIDVGDTTSLVNAATSGSASLVHHRDWTLHVGVAGVGGIAEQPDVTALPATVASPGRDYTVYILGAAVALGAAAAGAVGWRKQGKRALADAGRS